MTDIPTLFVATISADATLQSLMGVTASDPRIYHYYNSEAEVTEAKPAYITYALVSVPVDSQAVEEPVYSFLIWGRQVTVVEGVRDRLVTLFNKKELTTGTSRALYGRKVHETDSYQEQPNFAGKTLHFRFGYLSLAAIS